MPRPLLIFALLLLSPLKAFVANAQYYVTEHLLINEGQANNFVRDLVLDNKGRLWIATESGLSVYRGRTFTNINVSNSALSANMINCLWHEASAGRLWVGTKGAGICSLATDTGEVVCYNTPDSTLSNVLDITPATEGNLWLITPTDVMLLSPSDGRVVPVDVPVRDMYYRCGADDGNGNLIIGTHMQGASVLNARTRQLHALTLGGDKLSRVNVNRVMKDHAGRIWLATNVGLWYYMPGSSQLMEFVGIPRTEIFHIEEVDNRELWLATNHGIQVLTLATGQVAPLHVGGTIPMLTNIRSIRQDRHGNVWVGDNGNGVEFISHRQPYFRKLHDAPFWGIYSDGATTWAGTRNHVLGFEGTRLSRDIDISLGGRNYGAIFSINGDGHDRLYLAVPYQCLALDKASGRVQPILTPDGHNIEALTFYRENDTTLWITATDGVYELHGGGTVAVRSPINNRLNQQSANGIRRDRQGKLWVATYENGLYVFTPDGQLLSHLTQQTGFPSSSIQHLKFDSQGRLWMSTPDGPCCIPDTRFPERYVSYGPQDGLLDTYIRAIQEDRRGNIWMSTNNGISMLDLADRTFVNYSQADYIPVNNFNGGAIMQADGGIVFTSMQGLCHCYPDSLTVPRPKAPFHLQSVQVLGSGERGMEQHAILPDKKGIYHFGPTEGSFRLLFGAEDYAHNQHLEYECRLAESEGQWMPCTRGMVVFRNLEPGRYRIAVRARLKGQPWSGAHVVTTTVQIHHHWWSGWLARGIYALLSIGLLAVFVLHYLHRLQLKAELDVERQNNIEEQMRHAERLQFFSNITHELKTPLTLIQSPLEELLRDRQLSPAHRKRIQLVYDSSLRLTDLCNKLLDFRKAQTHHQRLTVSHGYLGRLVGEIGQSFVELNTNPQLAILVEVQPNEHPIFFDADVVRAMLTNLMSNALKYTLEGSITLRYRQPEPAADGHGQSVITVSDTGYGIPNEALPRIFDRYYKVDGPHQASGTGIGLAIVRSMAELHKVRIGAESQVGQGTTFTLTFLDAESYPDALHAQGVIDLPEAAPAPVLPQAEGGDDGRQMVLLVEDDYHILNFMAESIGNDYHVLMAHHGKEGLEMAVEQTPDVIVTDLMMPVMDGNTMCRRLKNDLRTSHIPIIMLTAKDTSADQMAGYADGADSYLTKPFSMQLLRTRIENILQARHRLTQWVRTQGLQALSAAATVPAEQPPASGAEGMPPLSAYDQRFLHDVEAYVMAHITSENILMEDIAQSLSISHSTLYRKIKALTGLTGSEYIRRIRILHSAELMLTQHCNVSEAAYRSGFSNLAYFRSAFRDVFGVTPSEYMKR